ncbi:MAG: o-succinylbenzoate synthase [Porphyromonadaceae bacterium CG2_30_38_12]|nr:MAG: o-succinylbenzoate synthase [Porphyromonadaceae bacterium CG2_30_38_12]
MKASIIKHILNFKFPAGTSRGVLRKKVVYYLQLEQQGKTGIGECSTIPLLSIDPPDLYCQKLSELCVLLENNVPPHEINLAAFPSIAFGLETALLSLNAKENQELFPSSFTQGKVGIDINGLVWMGDKKFMQTQIADKIALGYRCIKLKVGALDFETELDIIKTIRKGFSSHHIELRLDANGGFAPVDAMDKLQKLAPMDIHSIEQPIRQGQYEQMAELCQKSPIPIALDEELIGLKPSDATLMLQQIQPAYIILKPSLLGGFVASEQWIKMAEKEQIRWWVTSALESNVGLNAIAQWTYSLQSDLPQGLGTGQLYDNNIASPLEISNAKLFYFPHKKWGSILLKKPFI